MCQLISPVLCICLYASRTDSGMSLDSMIPIDPRDDNYDSSDTDSENMEMEASVLVNKSVPVRSNVFSSLYYWLAIQNMKMIILIMGYTF